MCCIAICDKRNLTLDEFNLIWKANQDGLGWAKHVGDKVLFKKGLMGAQASWDSIKELELPYVVHFRKQSIGATVPALTHPFLVSKDSPLDLEGTVDKVLFHNGTCGLWDNYLNAAGIYPEKDELTSDSRAIARIISNDNERFLNVISSSKFVLMDAKDKSTTYYQDSKDWINDNGILFSNTSWKPAPVVIHDYSKKNENYHHKKNQSGKNYGKHTYDFDAPWKGNVNPVNTVLRYLLNKMSKNAGKKLWRRFEKKQDLILAEEQALKILKQQLKKPEYDKIQRILDRKNGKTIAPDCCKTIEPIEVDDEIIDVEAETFYNGNKLTVDDVDQLFLNEMKFGKPKFPKMLPWNNVKINDVSIEEEEDKLDRLLAESMAENER